MDPATGWCEGCLRTIDEIIAWGSLDDEGKQAVWEALSKRRAQAVDAGRLEGSAR
jgi:predicted Fe-S protein YdhL (DUF1289 family)